MNIFLLGYRGSGKTTVGRLVAQRLRRQFVDLDERIVSKSGKTIKEIFEQHGEAHFRDLESVAVREAVALQNHVIALGGGAIKRAENREMIAKSGGRRIYLRCAACELHRRIHGDRATAANRPSLTHLGGGIEEITQLLAEREPIYQAVMTDEVDVTKLGADDVVQEIIARIGDGFLDRGNDA